MKARQTEPVGDGGNSMDGEVETVLDVEAAVSMHVDEKTGHRYSYNEATGQTQWLSNDNDGSEASDDGSEASEATDEEMGETKQTKTLFRKIVDDDDGVYYENTETGELVWTLPEDGDLEEL